MKRLGLVIIIYFTSLNTYAQQPPYWVNSTVGGAFVDSIASSYSGVDAYQIEGKFVSIVEENKQMVTTSRSEYSITTEGNKYRMRLINTEAGFTIEQEIISNGETVWFIDHYNEQVIISNSNPDEEHNFYNPLRLMKGASKKYTGFWFQELKDGKSVEMVLKTPADLSNNVQEGVKSVALQADNNYKLLRWILLNHDGSIITLTNENFKRYTQLSDNYFELRDSDTLGYYTEEMRN